MWLLYLLVIGGCSIMMQPEAPKSAKGVYYQVHYTTEHWLEKKDNRSDYIWMNSLDGRILLSNSFCDEFQDQPLERLAEKTFKVIDHLKIEKKSYTQFHEREAFRLEGSGLVDGVPVELHLLNTRRNNCYFDFVSITPLRSAAKLPPEFDHFLEAVTFK